MRRFASRWRLSGLLVPALVALALMSCTGDGDSAEDVSPTIVVSATSTAEGAETPTLGTATPVASTTTPVAGYEGFQILGDFTFTASVEFPQNLMVLIETGCTQCDSPPEAVYRVWRNDGQTHVDRLVDRGVAGSENHAYLLHTLGRPDIGDMLVAVCAGGSCGGVVDASPNAQIEFYRSTDGGISWSPFLTQPLGNAIRPALVTNEGILVAEDIAPGQEPRYRYLDGRDVPMPGNAARLEAGGWAGEVRWITADRNEVLNEDGSRLTIVEPGTTISSVAINREWRVPTPFVTWYESDRGRVVNQYITRMTEDYFQAGYSLEGFGSPQLVLDSGPALGNLTRPGSYAGMIGVFDLSNGTFTPIGGDLLQPPFGDGQTETSRNNLLAAVEGPFLRVTVGSDCLNIRAEAGPEAQVLTCAVDGVIVHDLQSSVMGDAAEWRHIQLLDGREGYASGDFLSPD